MNKLRRTKMRNSYLEGACDLLYGSSRIEVPDSAIPCIETSDPKRLCSNPLVSVRVVTYNHEPYIRKCLDSILEQKTDFEYEIVVGEDCSQDKTREICFEYQHKFPEKIRVLWSKENVFKLGGNFKRTKNKCRGEFIALLEGDDYWTDSNKLQKQIDLIRKTGAIACVANYATQDGSSELTPKIYTCKFLTHQDLSRVYPHTSTYVLKREFYHNRELYFPRIIGNYDVILLHCLVEIGKVAYLPDVVSVYRLTGKGIATSLSEQDRQLLAIKQYLDLYLHGPRSWNRRFGAVVLTYIAFFFNRSTRGWSCELAREKSKFLRGIFYRIFIRQFYDMRSIRALLRYVRFRIGFVR